METGEIVKIAHFVTSGVLAFHSDSQFDGCGAGCCASAIVFALERRVGQATRAQAATWPTRVVIERDAEPSAPLNAAHENCVCWMRW